LSEESQSLARLQILGAAVLFSTGGAAIKAISLTPWQVASFRCLVAAASISVMLPAVRRGISWRTALVGVAYAGALVCYVLANRLTTAASTIFLQSTSPLYLLLLSPWLLGERLRRRDLAFMLVLAGGLALLFVGVGPPVATAPNPALGNLLAASAGLSWAFAVVGLRWLGRNSQDRREAAGAVLCGNLVGFAACLPMALPVTEIPLRDAAILLFLGIFQVALAYVLFTAGLRHLPAFEVSLLLFLEPVLNPLWAWWLHSEVPGTWALAGGAVVLLATAMKVLVERAERLALRR
jgi:drug/metabolite transporter (DMT)-like permease